MARGLTNLRTGARLALLPLVFAVAGCSADDVEFNGKIFDVMGLNNNTKSAEPKLAERAPIVMPPNLERVPEPGTPPEAMGEVAALNDPDKAAQTSQAELQRRQAEYCKVNYEQAKARGDDNADLATGPLGPCRTSIVNSMKAWSGDEASE
jgi:hypothetical protein